ncbi:Crotonobetainyl-CoA:carnitine CoA-transferase CaiB [Albimonas donghaensis]|uniref:Crotonobetainyl-CoA:carnitine CoA-transferase CaiB n=1 Tax=Albimonas donghaensis TaxID=356660 RepID=A0A1H2VF12_9RHOB|nr:CoA transferase [Albimonas donghaensis]SDW66917.1 Crotonobetainyl-CoA:carnitine CoA-transferase CaiB [Albimonas donghaensis]
MTAAVQNGAHMPAGAVDDAPFGGPDGPMQGLKVLDLAWVVAGPMIGRNLADFGATVIRVESSKRVETARNMGPFYGGVQDAQRSSLFGNCNASKFGLTLDLAQEDGRDVVRDLVKWADVVVESFAPGQMKRWGLGYDKLRELNPRLIMLSTSLMGQTGPWTALAGFGNIGAAMAGYQGLVGPQDGLPIGPYGPYTDYVGPRFGLAALLSALDWRRTSGEGCWLDIAQAEAGMQMLAPAIADYAATGRVAKAEANRDAQMAPHGVFPSLSPEGADPRFVAIAARTDAEWMALAGVMGLDDLAADPALATLEGRKAAEDMLEARISEWTSARSPEDAEAALQAAGAPAYVVATAADLGRDPQIAEQGHFVNVPGYDWEVIVERCKMDLSETPARVARPAPTFGRDREKVLSEILGYDAARIEALDKVGALS